MVSFAFGISGQGFKIAFPDFYTHRCDGLDRQIDALVYDLYALTPEEIKIVKGTA